MLTVACVLKSGGIYDATWVARLRDGVARHLSLPYRFVCLSDVEVPCERIPLEHDWPGWWAKLEIFRLQGPILYFDLDSAIVGDLECAAYQAIEIMGVTALRDFYRADGVGSGVMAFGSAFFARPIYDLFVSKPEWWMRRIGGRGDQGFIEECGVSVTRWQDLNPTHFVSYKVHCRNGIPPNARVVCLHGRPKFGDMPANDPVRLAWEMAA